MSRYHKVEKRMWADARFRRMSRPQPNGQSLWQYLLTGPRTTPLPGLIIATEAVLADDLGWSLEGFRDAFAEPFREGLAKASWKDGLVILPKALLTGDGLPRITSHPGSPNVIRAWSKTWPDVPECALKAEYFEMLKSFAKALGKPFEDALGDTFGDGYPHQSPNQSRNQEQEQEQEQEERELLSLSPKPKPKPKTKKPKLASSSENQVSELWDLQNQLRQESIRGARTLAPAPGLLKAVTARLSEFGEESCRAVLRHYANESKRSQESAKYFDGVGNWRLENFTRALSRAQAAGIVDTAQGQANEPFVMYPEIAKKFPWMSEEQREAYDTLRSYHDVGEAGAEEHVRTWEGNPERRSPPPPQKSLFSADPTGTGLSASPCHETWTPGLSTPEPKTSNLGDSDASGEGLELSLAEGTLS